MLGWFCHNLDIQFEFEAGPIPASIDFAAYSPHCKFNGRTTRRKINGTTHRKFCNVNAEDYTQQNKVWPVLAMLQNLTLCLTKRNR